MDRATLINIAVWLFLAALVVLALVNTTGGCNTSPGNYWC